MHKIVLIPMLVFAVLFLNACMPVQDPAAMQAEVERIALEEAKQHFDNGTALFVDARSESDFDQAHIAGAIRLSPDQIATLGETLPKDQLIITYCTWPAEESSASLALQLHKNGYSQVKTLLGGMHPWVEAGYPMQEKQALTFMQMAEEAMGQVEGISAAEALERMTQDPDILLVDVSDAADVLATGLPAGGVNITLGMLPVRADLELPEQFRYAGLQDRSRPVITVCQGGPNGARAAKLLDDMGFTDVVYIEGGMAAWVEAGNPMQEPES